jgi:predicted RNase H-like HicB family nuclease
MLCWQKRFWEENTMKTRSFTVILHREDDTYIAECPEVGTVDQGETIEQAIAGLREATRLYLEEFPLPETSPRLVTSIEVSSKFVKQVVML